jgi:short-subunit dehydrogenase
MQYIGKVFWVTGASSGIGAALCLRLSELGATVILSSRREAELNIVKNNMADPKRHCCLALDLMDSSQFQLQLNKIIDKYGKIDVLVNNGGISQRSLALDTHQDVDRKVMEVDYFGTIALTKVVARVMVKQGFGCVVSIASIAGKLGSQYRSAYSASKHALIGFMDCLRAELTPRGLRVLVICPGWVKTNISYNALTADLTPFNQMDNEIDSGMPVDEFVGKLIKAFSSNKEEVVIATGLPLLGYHGRRLMPNLFHRISRKIYKKKL